MLRAKESNTGFDTVFVPVGTVDISPAVHCREKQRMNRRPVGTLEFPLEQDSSVLTGRGGERLCYPALKRRAKFNRPCRDEEAVKRFI